MMWSRTMGGYCGECGQRRLPEEGTPGNGASSTDVIDLVCMKEKTFKVTALGDTTQVLIRIHLSQALVCSLIVISTVLGN